MFLQFEFLMIRLSPGVRRRRRRRMRKASFEFLTFFFLGEEEEIFCHKDVQIMFIKSLKLDKLKMNDEHALVIIPTVHK